MPATSLPAFEHHLEARLFDLDKLHRERSHLPTALARANAGERIDRLLNDIAELQRLIDTAPPETLEDAAVKLRRLGAYVEQGQPARLLAGALGAVERAVEAGQLGRSRWGLSSSIRQASRCIASGEMAG